ncbi:MAG: MerR family transcriptional regulator [Bacteroidota bacterium]|nr:MerR family transcriptional regulator [Bacteroidota bacterium]
MALQQLDLFAASQEPLKQEVDNNVVFSDEKIKVKVKLKTTAPVTKEETPVEPVTETASIEQASIAEEAAAIPSAEIVAIQDEKVETIITTPEEIQVQQEESTVTENIVTGDSPLSSIEFISEQKEEIPLTFSDTAAKSSKRGRKSYKEVFADANDIELPDDETLNQKLYYSISEVAGWFKVNVSQIRYWENEFDILQPRKTRKGDRLFRVEDIKNLKLIYFLLRNRKFSIEGAKEYLKANKHKAEMNEQLVASLTKFRSFLLEMKANLES